MSAKRGFLFPTRLALLWLAMLFFLPISSVAEVSEKRVVVLHSYHQGFKWTDDISAGISEVMQTWPTGVELIHEYMDSKRRWDKNYKMLLEGLLSYKYRNMQPDAVIVSDNLAFEYMCESGKDVFPGVPVFFCGVNYLDPQVLEGLPNFTGISEVVDIDRNIELISRLHPELSEIVFVVDNTETGRILSAYLDGCRKKYQKIKIRQLTDVTFAELSEEVSRLRPGSAVIWSIFFRDRAGRFLEFDDGASLIASASQVPVYCLWDFSLGYGPVGGFLTSGYEQGSAVARKVIQYFGGTPLAGLPVRYEPVTVPKFDWKMLEKFKINDALLPEGAFLQGRPASVTDQFREWVILGLSLIFVLIGVNLVLSYIINKRTRELVVARDRAEAANRAKSQFLANMSHELRTPLNGVIGFTELLLGSKLENSQGLYARNANTAALSLLGIINNILDFSKIEAGKLELEKVKTDLPQLVEQNVAAVRFAAEKKKIELLLNISPGIPRYFHLDPVRFGQILVNLLSNAIKFTERGEVELKIELENGDGRRGLLVVSVRDTGIGIEAAEVERIFKEFSQADNSTTRRFGGTGLGLTIARLLVEKMGGILKLESRPGTGSLFYFSIPVEFEPGEPFEAHRLKSLQNILIVDDNEQNRIILKEMLEKWGISVQTVAGGTQAEIMVNSGLHFDAIIMDYMMPGQNGIETIRKIRMNQAHSGSGRQVILLCSSIDDPEVLADCHELGVEAKLIKPVRPNDLYIWLCRIVEQNSSSVESRADIKAAANDFLQSLRPKIMVVEDVEMNMVIACELIAKIVPGADLIKAEGGRQAVEAFTKEHPDLVFMDLQMPEVDGYTAVREIRRSETAGVHIPIIALTASAIKGELEKCLEAGMDDLICKPVEPKVLESVLRRFLAGENLKMPDKTG